MKLSDKQIEAIGTNNENLRIIACAGSGKTTTIAEKVAYLLNPINKLNVFPHNIIAFTYTEKAAAELKNRILRAVGSLKGLANMYVGTIHGWCLKALQENEFAFQKYSVLDEIKLKLFVDKYYEKIGMKEVFKLANPKEPMRRFVDTGRYTKLMEILRESEIQGKLPENILKAKEMYEETLHSKNYFDFAMIIDKALEILKTKNSNLRSKIQEDLKYLIVDEYQDVNSKQEDLIYTLKTISNAILTVVGDDDQNIYQWRGSNNQYIIDFDKKYRSKTIPLVRNYRSSIGITKIAETLINNNTKRLAKQMESNETQDFVKGRDVIYNEYDDIEDENKSIANFIKKLIGREFKDDKNSIPRGLAFSDCCILLRTWSKAEGIVEALEAQDIPYITAGVNHLFQTPEVKAALGIFEYLNGYITDQNELKELWLKLPFKDYDVSKLVYAIQKIKDRFPKKRSELKEGEKFTDKDFAYNLQDIFWEFIEVAEIFEESFIDSASEDAEEIKKTKERAEILFFNLGKFSQVIRDFEEINFNSSTGSFHLFNFLSFINYAAQEYYPEGWINNPYKIPNAVQIMTIHQAKGLEFPVVFVPGLNRNYMPQKAKGGLSEWHFLNENLIKNHDRYKGDIEDERRLLYVAITRAQKFLLLSRAPDANNRLYQKESIFVEELDKSKRIFQNKNESFNYLQQIESKPLDKIRSITLNFTVLKDFFDCPYRFKLISMYGFSFPLSQRMGLGRSFHNALMELHKRAKKGHTFSEQQINDIANRQMDFPYMAESDILKPTYDKMIKQNLNEYYSDTKDSLSQIAFVEQDIELKLEDEILVTGRIDLIKKELDNHVFETTIIEFKSEEETSRSSKINELQLKLYALGHKELTGEMANYIMTYIIGGNDPKGHVKHILTNEDLIEIQKRINLAAKRIRNQEFLRTEDKKICSECRQNSICSHRVKFNVNSLRD